MQQKKFLFKLYMDLFYKIVISVAIIFLVVILITVGVMSQNIEKNMVYPPTHLVCPDYWTDISGVCQPGSVNLGKLTNTSNPIDFNGTSWKSGGNYTGLSETCAKKKWATDNNILWDGISNYNSC